MNFLAHLYLSGKPGPLMIGNFIGDYVKGKQVEKFSSEIQKGIYLHRKIDSFTDSHEIVKISASRFKSCYNRYSSVVIDVVYDHYLANNWNLYSSIPLNKYVDSVHSYLLRNYFTLPNQVKGFLPFLIKSRRIENYKYLEGIKKSLSIMSNHSSLPSKSDCAIKVMKEQYHELNGEFVTFFSELKEMVDTQIKD